MHLDLDVLVLKPLDNLFDVMMHSERKAGDEPLDLDLSHIDVQWPSNEPTKQLNALFTRDCKFQSPTATVSNGLAFLSEKSHCPIKNSH